LEVKLELCSVNAKFYVFKYRPSSHSDDYSIVATYKDFKKAAKVEKALEKLLEDIKKHENDYDTDWNPDEARVSQDGCKVWFEVYTAGYLEDVESVIYKVAVPQEVECYQNYQELTIRVNLPRGLTLESAMLVLEREEAEALKWFKNVCGEPKIIGVESGSQTIEWFYSGDEICSDGTLYIGFEFYVGDRENWEVE